MTNDDIKLLDNLYEYLDKNIIRNTETMELLNKFRMLIYKQKMKKKKANERAYKMITEKRKIDKNYANTKKGRDLI